MITNQTGNLSGLDYQSGQVILIDKPKLWSSFKVVNKIRHTVKVKKVGHAGTLDPLATGLLIICTGKKTKEIFKYQDLKKTYTGTILLGKKTPSMDTETEVTEEYSVDGITEDKIKIHKEKFTGEIEQLPPMYSAIKHKGKSLYKIARKGKTVERTPRIVFVEKFEILNIDIPNIEFKIICSKGTYIRVIANDLGESLGCGGILSELRRTGIGSYSVNDSLKIDEFIEKVNVKNKN